MEALSRYRLLSKEQQGDLLGAIAEKIRSMIGVHGDIHVLVEYISVMLQSAKHRDDIEQELEAFLQDGSRHFVAWLAQQLEAVASDKETGGDGNSPSLPRTRALSKDAPRDGRSRSPGRKKPAAEPTAPRRRPGGLAASLFGRALRDAQRSVKTTADAPEERSPPERHVEPPCRQESPPADRLARPTLVPRSPPAATARAQSDSYSRSRSRGRGPTTARSGAAAVEMQASPCVRGRAGALAAAVADAAASTASNAAPGTRNLPPRPRRAPPLPPPPRAVPMHMVSGGTTTLGNPEDSRFAHDSRWGPPALPHGAAPYQGGLAPGPPPQTAPPQPGPPPATSPEASTPPRRRARLAPVKIEDDEDTSRWHFHAPPGSTAGVAAGPPPSGPPPSAYGTAASAFGPLPHQMVTGAPGYAVWTAPVPGPPPASAPRAAPSVTTAHAHAAPPPVVQTVFEYQPAPAPTPAPAPAPQRVVPSLSAPPRPRNFVPQKWRVISAELVVGASEHLDSKQVRTLREGEIVESVGPPFSLPNGAVRLEIAHPSSAAYPNPIGWVTQDASANGGTKNLEPGPQPVQAAMRSVPAPRSFGGGHWKGGSRPSYRPKGGGKGVFSNVIWRPPN